MNLAEHLNVIGPAIALFVGSGAVLLIGLVSPARAYSFTLTCLSLIAVSYTHLTLPTNREV